MYETVDATEFSLSLVNALKNVYIYSSRVASYLFHSSEDRSLSFGYGCSIGFASASQPNSLPPLSCVHRQSGVGGSQKE